MVNIKNDENENEKGKKSRSIGLEMFLAFLLSFSLLYFIYIMIYSPCQNQNNAEKSEMLRFTEKGEPSF